MNTRVWKEKPITIKTIDKNSKREKNKKAAQTFDQSPKFHFWGNITISYFSYNMVNVYECYLAPVLITQMLKQPSLKSSVLYISVFQDRSDKGV